MKKTIYKVLLTIILLNNITTYTSEKVAEATNPPENSNANSTSQEEIEYNPKEEFIKEILRQNTDPKIQEILNKSLNNESLDKEESYLYIIILKQYINNYYHDISIKSLLNQNLYGLKTLELNQNGKTFNQHKLEGEQKYLKFSELLAELSNIKNSPNLNINSLPAVNFTDSTWNDLEKLSSFRVDLYDLYRTNNAPKKNDINQQFDPKKSLLLPLLSFHKKDTILFQEIGWQKLDEQSLSKFTQLATDISSLFQNLKLLEHYINDEKVSCQDFLKQESNLHEKRQSIERSLPCDPKYDDLNRIGNNDGFQNITKRIIQKLKLGDIESINETNLKSFISLSDVKKALHSDLSLTSKQKNDYYTYFFNISLSISKNNIQQNMNKDKRNITNHNTSLNAQLEFILNDFSLNKSFLKKTQNKKQYILEFDQDTISHLDSILNFNEKKLSIMRQINELPTSFDRNLAWISLTTDYLLKYAISDVKSMKKKLPLFGNFIHEIFLKKFALANLSLMHHFGNPIVLSDQPNEIIYSNSRIVSDGNSRDLQIDPEYKEAKILGNIFNFFDGAGGSGKTSALETFTFEVMSASIIGKTAAAKMTLPKKMLQNRIYFIQKNASVLHEPSGRPLSGSQSTLANMRDINRVCEEALSKGGYVMVIMDEGFSTVDELSLAKMISSHEAIKEALDKGILFFQIIEHNQGTANKVSGRVAVQFPNKIESTQNKSNQMNQFIIDKIKLHTLDEADCPDYRKLEEILSNPVYQGGQSIPLYAKINSDVNSIDLVTEEEYKIQNKKNNKKYITIPFTLKTSLNDLEAESTNVYIDSEAIYVKPLIGEIYFNNQYYIYIIPISLEKTNDTIQIAQLKKEKSLLTARSKIFIQRNIIQYYFNENQSKNYLPADNFALLRSLIVESINNYRNSDLDTLNRAESVLQKPEEESIFKDEWVS